MIHDAHIVQKIRHGGDRDGEVTYYLVGPTRHTLRDAHNDAAMMDPSAVLAEIDELNARIADLERRLAREEEARALLMSTLAEERARGAVALDGIDRLLRAFWMHPDHDKPNPRGWSKTVRYVHDLTKDCSPAATALLDLAEAAVEVACDFDETELASQPESVRMLCAAVDRWREVGRGD